MEWAEGEWITDPETGEQLWQPADGGEAVSAEAWAAAMAQEQAEDAGSGEGSSSGQDAGAREPEVAAERAESS